MMLAVIFDFDGVIVNSEPLHWRAFVDVLRPMGLEVDYLTYLQRYVGCDDRDFYRLFFKDRGRSFDEQALPRMIEAKARAFERIVEQGVEAIDGAVELVTACAERWPVGLCSGALRRDIECILPRIGDGTLMQRFGAVVTADDVARSKPDPAGYLLAAERLGVAPGECVAIEDTPAGIASALGAGLKTLALTTTCPADALTDADRIVESLTQVDPNALAEWFE